MREGKLKRQQVDITKIPPALFQKWPGLLLQEGFVPFPKKFLRSLTRLFGSTPEIEELATLLAIVDYRRDNLIREPSFEYLAFVAGLPKDRLKGAMNRLEAKGWVRSSSSDSVECVPSMEVSVDLSGFYKALERAIDNSSES